MDHMDNVEPDIGAPFTEGGAPMRYLARHQYSMNSLTKHKEPHQPAFEKMPYSLWFSAVQNATISSSERLFAWYAAFRWLPGESVSV